MANARVKPSKRLKQMIKLKLNRVMNPGNESRLARGNQLARTLGTSLTSWLLTWVVIKQL